MDQEQVDVVRRETLQAFGGRLLENQQRATKRLMVVIPASLAIIFLLLFLTFVRSSRVSFAR
jgi:Cu/Ag efflux pump CusA